MIILSFLYQKSKTIIPGLMNNPELRKLALSIFDENKYQEI